MQEKMKQPYSAPLIEHFEVKMEECLAAGSAGDTTGSGSGNSGGGGGGGNGDGGGWGS
ncbi:hypothetical protein D3C87_251080 [compost metagenome]